MKAPMSGLTDIRRQDLAMGTQRAEALLRRGFCGRLATVGADGAPYCTTMLYLWMEGAIHMHGTRARGHLRSNIDHEPRACFVIDEPGEVFDYGRFECDSTVSYTSVIAFGRVTIVEVAETKQRFFETLMAKYRTAGPARPAGFFPRLDQITLYALAIERLTGKEIVLPDMAGRWPAIDRSKTPNARPADRGPF
jgi:nitroimidazol reductase NimA-like FMN-containing flavoprotein (pyridoxamine 5'-phosphate oxidase superfamily)